ncbi:MAG: thermonuclease family protein [Planctomycetota bacterium]
MTGRLKYGIVIAVVATALAVVAFRFHHPENVTQHIFEGAPISAVVETTKADALKVVSVTDGDTLKVLNGKTVTIRLNGIDCPEKAQAFGQKAKQFTSEMVFGKLVTVKEKGRDRYGRTIGEVILEDGRNLNRELVRAGMAWWYRQYAPKDAELEVLELEAREAKRGLWVDADPVPPWEWRKRKRKGD